MKKYDVLIPVYVTMDAETPEEAVVKAVDWFDANVPDYVRDLRSDVQTEDAYECEHEPLPLSSAEQGG